MTDRRFRADAIEAGFSDKQIEFLLENVSHPGHHHSTDQIDGLEEAVSEIVESEEDEEEEEHEHPSYYDHE
jgi:hypothetical protein